MSVIFTEKHLKYICEKNLDFNSNLRFSVVKPETLENIIVKAEMLGTHKATVYDNLLIFKIAEDLNIMATDDIALENNIKFTMSKFRGIDFHNVHTEHMTDMNNMFDSCTSLEYIDMSDVRTDNVTDMNRMFRLCRNLKLLRLNSFNTDMVRDMAYMFLGCERLIELDLSNFSGKSVHTLTNMFSTCIKLKTLKIPNLFKHFKAQYRIRGLTNLSLMFMHCDSLEDIYLGCLGENAFHILDQLFAGCPNIKNIYVADSFEVETVELHMLKNHMHNYNKVNIQIAGA